MSGVLRIVEGDGTEGWPRGTVEMLLDLPADVVSLRLERQWRERPGYRDARGKGLGLFGDFNGLGISRSPSRPHEAARAEPDIWTEDG